MIAHAIRRFGDTGLDRVIAGFAAFGRSFVEAIETSRRVESLIARKGRLDDEDMRRIATQFVSGSRGR